MKNEKETMREQVAWLPNQHTLVVSSDTSGCDEAKDTQVPHSTQNNSLECRSELSNDSNRSSYYQYCSDATQNDDSPDTTTAQSLDDWLMLVDGEGARDVWCQSMIPFLIAGFGSIGAGLVVHFAQETTLVKAVPQFLSVAPPLQGMKGNLDLTLTSRLTTMAHQGKLDTSQALDIFLRNMSLIQTQAIIFSIISTTMCFLLDLLKRIPFGIPASVSEFLFLGAVSIETMCLSSLLMSSSIILIIIITTKKRMNPDNIATPMSASVGDFLTVVLLTSLGILTYHVGGIDIVHPLIVITLAILTIPIWMYIACKDANSLLAVKNQWPTLLIASLFSSGAGFIQEIVFKKYPEFTVYLPMIAGISGNRVAVHASRISSFLMVQSFDPIKNKIRSNPMKYYFYHGNESEAARLLLFTCVPYQCLFLFASQGVAQLVGTPLSLNFPFFVGYMMIVFMQVAILLYICQLLVTTLWSHGKDPDLHSIPILTSIGDLLGTILLTGLFEFFSYMGTGAVKMNSMPSNSTIG